MPDEKDSIDYNDIRVILGLEWTALSGRNGFFEIGYAWNRELVYVSRNPVNFNPNDAVMLRAGVSSKNVFSAELRVRQPTDDPPDDTLSLRLGGSF